MTDPRQVLAGLEVLSHYGFKPSRTANSVVSSAVDTVEEAFFVSGPEPEELTAEDWAIMQANRWAWDGHYDCWRKDF